MKKLALITLVSACAQTDSSDALTSGMYADLGASSTGTGTTAVHATLYFGNPINLNFVDLTGDDELIASHDGLAKVMLESEFLNIVSHRAEFQTAGAGDEGAAFEIDFSRTVDAGAPRSIATLPAPFTFEPPPAQSSRAADLTLTWTPSGTADRMAWTATGECVENASGSITADPGSLTIAANALVKKQGSALTSCNVTVEITRSREGELDLHYGKGGSIFGRQVRNGTFTSMP